MRGLPSRAAHVRVRVHASQEVGCFVRAKVRRGGRERERENAIQSEVGVHESNERGRGARRTERRLDE